MTRAKEMRDLPLALDVDSSGKVLIGQTSTGAYSSADNLILGFQNLALNKKENLSPR